MKRERERERMEIATLLVGRFCQNWFHVTLSARWKGFADSGQLVILTGLKTCSLFSSSKTQSTWVMGYCHLVFDVLWRFAIQKKNKISLFICCSFRDVMSLAYATPMRACESVLAQIVSMQKCAQYCNPTHSMCIDNVWRPRRPGGPSTVFGLTSRLMETARRPFPRSTGKWTSVKNSILSFLPRSWEEYLAWGGVPRRLQVQVFHLPFHSSLCVSLS